MRIAFNVFNPPMLEGRICKTFEIALAAPVAMLVKLFSIEVEASIIELAASKMVIAMFLEKAVIPPCLFIFISTKERTASEADSIIGAIEATTL